MYILGIDTTKSIGTLCLYASDNDKCVIQTLHDPKISENLLVELQNFLEREKVKFCEIKGIGVNIGPGSFTGLRVGVAFAKGLAKAIGCKCVFSSLEDCLREIVKDESFRQGKLLINLGKKGVIVYSIIAGQLSTDSKLVSLNELKDLVKNEKDIFLYNLSDLELNLENELLIKMIASDNVIKKLIIHTKSKLNQNNSSTQNIIYI